MASILDYLTQNNTPQMTYQGVQQSLAQPQSMVDPSTLSSRIQQWLGAKPQDQGGQAQDILSSRFIQNQPTDLFAQPTTDDAGNAALSSLNSGQYVSSQAYTDKRMNDAMAKMTALKKLQENSGGATGELVDRYMKTTGATFPEALQAVQTGFRQNMLIGPDGKVQVIPGAAQAKSALSYAEKGGAEQGQKDVDLRMNPSIERATQDQKNQSDINAKAPLQVQTEIGNVQGKAVSSLPQTEQNVAYSRNLLSSLVNHPGIDTSVGLFSLAPTIPGTEQADFRKRLNQINGQAFLQAFAGLRGAGSISNAEGEAATEAITRLNAATNKTDFVRAANELSRLLDAGLSRQKAEAQGSFINNNGVDLGVGNPGLNLSGANALPQPGENLNIDPSAALNELRRRGHKL